ncbi:MAG TPA: sigma factor [Gemmataceae bacterium]|jgi:RNA polymerase sigma-70 factor (ECF subfamily)|nr:sigma factor [Gemmataceae bacterium]
MADSSEPIGRDSQFPTTQWSVVARAGVDNGSARAAVAELCREYWYPLYAFARRSGATAAEAEDLTQGFFTHFLEDAVYSQADPARGRFRTFLLRCFRNYQSNHRRADRAKKRGGGAAVVALDSARADAAYKREPVDPADPERLYFRRWALTVIDDVFVALGAEFVAAGRGPLFDRLKSSLLGDGDGTYARIGSDFDMTEDAVKQTASRLRARFGNILRVHIGALVVRPEEVDDEIRDLMAAVAE